MDKPGEEVITITDSSGNKAVFDSLPQRITFSGKASNLVADVLYMFPEAAQRIVGVGNTNQFSGPFAAVLDPDFEDKFYFEHSAGPEQLAVSRPDLVILKNYLKGSLGDPLGQLDIPVLYLDLESPESYEKDLQVLGQIFGNPDRADELIRYYREGMRFVTDRTASLGDKPDVLFLYHSTKDGVSAFNTPPEEWIQTRMVEMAGGRPVWADAHSGSGWNKVNMEQIAAWNPDQVYIVAYKENVDEVLDEIYSSPQWKEMKSAQKEMIKAFPVDYYSWDQPDSRWILGLKWLGKMMHPDLFEDLNIEKEARSFFKDLYGLTDEQFEREIASRLGWKD
ncbi:ABC transporter substrate-binding protein [Spirochaeta isovalerica]|uniref:Iron complex transport system substrate-binding protein n=1 Tax=Spirochaeta isovalerica TaxID=150 RepID=A0A841RBY1_9SPIO|nr:ABC transporter substrate-binding protein [Spirochaeta isovalerica]MBB6481485.1 iron complex transport system substrate-binding protein [Spirochaeta isovalerica]